MEVDVREWGEAVMVEVMAAAATVAQAMMVMVQLGSAAGNEAEVTETVVAMAAAKEEVMAMVVGMVDSTTKAQSRQP